ncbi:hypothetical protein V6N13_020059 [Hibiscus sabdariffa]|uniref:Uncharacterized protein n=1 Tax=Hibiscus sabdariffa TaxID=183260 RepID=A0ABR2ESB9_9ROSI
MLKGLLGRVGAGRFHKPGSREPLGRSLRSWARTGIGSSNMESGLLWLELVPVEPDPVRQKREQNWFS